MAEEARLLPLSSASLIPAHVDSRGSSLVQQPSSSPLSCDVLISCKSRLHPSPMSASYGARRYRTTMVNECRAAAHLLPEISRPISRAGICSCVQNDLGSELLVSRIYCDCHANSGAFGARRPSTARSWSSSLRIVSSLLHSAPLCESDVGIEHALCLSLIHI